MLDVAVGCCESESESETKSETDTESESAPEPDPRPRPRPERESSWLPYARDCMQAAESEMRPAPTG